MPRIACRVVCGRLLVMATFAPTSALVSVDFPEFGRPTTQANPARYVVTVSQHASGACRTMSAHGGRGGWRWRCGGARRPVGTVQAAASGRAARGRLPALGGSPAGPHPAAVRLLHAGRPAGPLGAAAAVGRLRRLGGTHPLSLHDALPLARV